MHVEFRDRLQACTVSRHFYRYTKVQNLMYLYLGLRMGLEIWSRLATLGPIGPTIGLFVAQLSSQESYLKVVHLEKSYNILWDQGKQGLNLRIPAKSPS